MKVYIITNFNHVRLIIILLAVRCFTPTSGVNIVAIKGLIVFVSHFLFLRRVDEGKIFYALKIQQLLWFSSKNVKQIFQ